MTIDHNSLFVAFCLSASGLAVAFFVNWMASRGERFLMAWTVGVACMALGMLGHGTYSQTLSPIVGVLGYTALLVGLSFVYGAGRVFRTGRMPWTVMATMAFASSASMAAPMLSGLNGVAMIVLNTAAAIILAATALDYWRGRAEARLSISTLSAFYAITGASFVPCAAIIASSGQWTFQSAPSNWAEDLNLYVCLASLAGIGALSLALNQSRVARGHKRDAETDPLTGLLNRRALQRRVTEEVKGAAAVVVFDVDRFKSINDLHGHLAGDGVLRSFAAVLTASTPPGGICARLGGEEFALVVPATTLVSAAILADDVRVRFASERFGIGREAFICTVSAGVAQTDRMADLDVQIRRADEALYAAKANGRNCVAVGSDDDVFKAEMKASSGGQRGPVDLIRLKVG